jgi:hypothetical protein
MKTIKYLLFISLSILLSACCDEIYTGRLEVDVTPIYDLNIGTQEVQRLSDLIDLDKFSPAFPNDEPSNILFWGYVGNTEVRFYLETDIATASDTFTYECEAFVDDPSRIEYGGEGDNQYCLPYVTEIRMDPEGFCLPTDNYSSYVVFQKGRLAIEINDVLSKPNGEDLDEVIKSVADAFR